MFGLPVEIAASFLVLVGGALGWVIRRWLTGAHHKEDTDSIKQAVELNSFLQQHGMSFAEARQLRDSLRDGKQLITPAMAKALNEQPERPNSDSDDDSANPTHRIGFSDTTAGMKLGMGMRLEQLNAELQYLIAELSHGFSPAREHALLQAQESWEKFRADDAVVSALLWEGGTGAPLLDLSRQVELTEDRVAQLRRLKEQEEAL